MSFTETLTQLDAIQREQPHELAATQHIVSDYTWGGWFMRSEMHIADVGRQWGSAMAMRERAIAKIAGWGISAANVLSALPPLPALQFSSPTGLKAELLIMKPTWPVLDAQVEEAGIGELFSSSKREVEEWANKPLSWPEWVSRPTLLGGPDRRTMAKLLHWNMLEMLHHTWQQRDQSETYRQTYLAQIDAAHSDKRVSGAFLDAASRRLPKVRFAWAGPLYPFTGGKTLFNDPGILLSVGVKPDTIRHELTHTVGGFSKSLYIEACTDLLLSTVDPATQNTLSLHHPGQIAVTSLLERAGISRYELSDIFAGQNLRHNTIRLYDRIDSAAGRGAAGRLAKFYDQRLRFYLSHQAGGMAHFYAGIDCMCRQDPSLDYEAAIRLARSELSDEDVARHLHAIDTYRNNSDIK